MRKGRLLAAVLGAADLITALVLGAVELLVFAGVLLTVYLLGAGED
jgi:hypothetical protein